MVDLIIQEKYLCMDVWEPLPEHFHIFIFWEQKKIVFVGIFYEFDLKVSVFAAVLQN